MLRFTGGFVAGLIGGALAVFLLLLTTETAKRRQLQQKMRTLEKRLALQKTSAQKLHRKVEQLTSAVDSLTAENNRLMKENTVLRKKNRMLTERFARLQKETRKGGGKVVQRGGEKFIRGAAAAAIKGLLTGEPVPQSAADELRLSPAEKLALEDALKDEARRMKSALSEFASKQKLSVGEDVDLATIVGICFRACAGEFKKLHSSLTPEDLTALQTGKKRLSDILGKDSVLVSLGRVLAGERAKTLRLLERDLRQDVMGKLRRVYLRIDVFKFKMKAADGSELPMTLNFYRQGIEPRR